jgi:hypothetical protein
VSQWTVADLELRLTRKTLLVAARKMNSFSFALRLAL